MSLSDRQLESMLSKRALANFVADDADEVVDFAARSMVAPHPHHSVRVMAASIFARYVRRAEARRAVANIADTDQGCTREQFKVLFAQRDSRNNRDLHQALVAVGLQ